MLKKGQLILAFALLLSLMVTAGAPIGAQEMSAADTVGGDATGVVYEQKDAINNGEPITLTIWDWHTPRVVLWERLAPLYTELYPNVTFEITQTPWEEYWTKAAAAIPAGQGPDIMHFHNSFHTQFVGNNLFEPFPEDMFDPAFLEENWMGFKERHFHDAEGNIRYLPYGAMAAALFINTKMWEEAGLTEADAPKTWDDLLVLAEKLVKRDEASGLIDIAGFVFNDYLELLWNDMNYQQGRYLYTADGKGCQVDTPEGRKSLETIMKFYEANVNSFDFLSYLEGFGTEKAAMSWSWLWMADYLRQTYPDLEFFTLNMPSFTGESLPALGRQNYEVSMVVPVNNEPERTAVAWDFLHWLYSQDEVLVDLALAHQITPAYMKLRDHPRILADQAIAQLGGVIDYKVFPGEFPDAMWNTITQNIGQNIVAGASIDEALAMAEEACDMAMAELDYWTLERSYAHNDAMVADQP